MQNIYCAPRIYALVNTPLRISDYTTHNIDSKGKVREEVDPVSVLNQYIQQREEGLVDSFIYTNNIYVDSYLEVYVHSTSGECVNVLLDHIYEKNLETLHTLMMKAILSPQTLLLPCHASIHKSRFEVLSGANRGKHYHGFCFLIYEVIGSRFDFLIE